MDKLPADVSTPAASAEAEVDARGAAQGRTISVRWPAVFVCRGTVCQLSLR